MIFKKSLIMSTANNFEVWETIKKLVLIFKNHKNVHFKYYTSKYVQIVTCSVNRDIFSWFEAVLRIWETRENEKIAALPI